MHILVSPHSDFSPALASQTQVKLPLLPGLFTDSASSQIFPTVWQEPQFPNYYISNILSFTPHGRSVSSPSLLLKKAFKILEFCWPSILWQTKAGNLFEAEDKNIAVNSLPHCFLSTTMSLSVAIICLSWLGFTQIPLKVTPRSIHARCA